MTAQHRPPNDSGPEGQDRALERMLGEAFQASPLREEFAASLSASLDAEFAQQSQAGVRNGRDFLASAMVEAGADSTDAVGATAARPSTARPLTTTNADLGDEAARGRRWTLRAPVAFATVASIVIAAIALSSRPSYSWAAMIDAMNDRAWVHAETVRNGAAHVRRWLAPGQGVDASKVDGRVVLIKASGGGREKLTFAEGDDKVISESAPGAGAASDWQRLLPALLGSPDRANVVAAEVIDESWRRVRGDQGQELIELTVTLSIAGEAEEWLLLLDPDTSLPVVARASAAAGGSGEVRFSYPDSGPTSLADLGAPAGAEIVSMRAGDRADPLEIVAADVEPPAAKPVDPLPPLGDPLPDAELTAEVDRLLAEHWETVGVSPAERSSDEEFLRRVYLDLTGRIPTVGEARIFFEDDRPDRRLLLIDELLTSRDHATHLAVVWRRGLIPPSVDLSIYGGPDRLDEWLADRFQDNMPYDQLASELLLAEGRISESGPLLFYAALKLNPEEIAAQTSRVFLGMRMECAQCHDHMFDDRLAQEDFWGLAALFAQISRPRGQMDTTSSVLRVHDIPHGEVYLPDTDTVVPPRLPLSDVPVASGEDSPSRRKQFVDWLVEPHNDRFAQAAANRVWANLFGRGLVEPVDDIRDENPAVVPGVLELLGKDFARSGFDLRRLLRQLVLTDAYQLSSESENESDEADLVFARMNIKSFTAEQLYDCIAVATRGAAFNAAGPTGPGIVRTGDTSREQFIRLFEAPGGHPVDYHAGIPQALTLMHGGLIHSATDLGTSGLLKSLSAPFFTDQQRVETLFLATLSRGPSDAEMRQMSGHVAIAATDEDRRERLGDVLWALLNTAEFTLNH